MAHPTVQFDQISVVKVIQLVCHHMAIQSTSLSTGSLFDDFVSTVRHARYYFCICMAIMRTSVTEYMVYLSIKSDCFFCRCYYISTNTVLSMVVDIMYT